MLVYNESWVEGTPTRAMMKEASPLFTFAQKRNPPFHDLHENQRIVISASKGPGLGTMMYESRIRFLVTGSYTSLDEAWQMLRESIPSDIRTKGGWDKQWFMTRDYTMRASKSGWMIGWLDVPVRWIGMPRPKSLVLQRNGWGSVPDRDISDKQAKKKISIPAEGVDERHERDIMERSDIGPREKLTLIKSRRGQGKFKTRVASHESRCRVTGTTTKKHLIASHIKPWATSDDREKLDGHNGLLLAPHVDHLFNAGLISFKDNGDMMLSPRLDRTILREWNLPSKINVGSFLPMQLKYLKEHRNTTYKK